jgi:hypothetical protein
MRAVGDDHDGAVCAPQGNWDCRDENEGMRYRGQGPQPPSRSSPTTSVVQEGLFGLAFEPDRTRDGAFQVRKSTQGNPPECKLELLDHVGSKRK